MSCGGAKDDRKEKSFGYCGSCFGSVFFDKIPVALCDSLFDCLDFGEGPQSFVKENPQKTSLEKGSFDQYSGIFRIFLNRHSGLLSL